MEELRRYEPHRQGTWGQEHRAVESMVDALKYDLIRELLPEVLPNTRISLAEPKIIENNS
jgi:hypothetical protein